VSCLSEETLKAISFSVYASGSKKSHTWGEAATGPAFVLEQWHSGIVA